MIRRAYCHLSLSKECDDCEQVFVIKMLFQIEVIFCEKRWLRPGLNKPLQGALL